MTAIFTTAIRYKVNAVCETPLRTGGAGGNLESVLRDSCGNAFLQGSSLAGALRGWLEKSSEKHHTEALFGSQEHEGHLIVSDAVLRADSEQSIRPRLKINGKSGTAAVGSKFDVANIVPGSHLSFELTWLGSEQESNEIAAVERMLGAVNCGEIKVGAQKSNGFGKLSLSVHKRIYNLFDEKDRTAWQDGCDDGDLIELPKIASNEQVVFDVDGFADSVLIKTSAQMYENNLSYAVNITENGQPVLPGSSVKGTIRAQCTRITESAGVSEYLLEELFGRGARDGDNGQSGAICVDDVHMEGARKQKIKRIRINRFTGGVIRGGLFAEEPLSGEVRLHISARAKHEACYALLVYALRDLGLGLYGLGSGDAIGRGYIAVKQIKVQAPDGRKAAIAFDKNRVMRIEDADGLLNEWQQAWKECMV